MRGKNRIPRSSDQAARGLKPPMPKSNLNQGSQPYRTVEFLKNVVLSHCLSVIRTPMADVDGSKPIQNRKSNIRMDVGL